jgi:dolichol-phosphate mannosyltransferase
MDARPVARSGYEGRVSETSILTPQIVGGATAAELSVIAPTMNERANVARLVDKLAAALEGERWEVIFVDDNSADGTWEAVKEMAQLDPRVRCLRRVGRRGLSGAVVEGFLASSAPFVAAIDADMQHDETLLPRMLAAIRGDCDIVVGSRYLEASGLDQGLSPIRKAGSRLTSALARRALGVEVSDPMAGFFMVRREAVERVAPRLESSGFKVLFDLLACQPTPLRVKELAYSFKERAAGESKMDARVVLEYFGLLAARLSGDLVSPDFLFFLVIGSTGLAVHMLVLALTQRLPLTSAQALAALTAMTSNYLLGNYITYRDRRRSGWRLIRGYIRFCAICALGLAGSVAVATVLHAHGVPRLLAGLVGAGCGAVWNYIVIFIGGG